MVDVVIGVVVVVGTVIIIDVMVGDIVEFGTVVVIVAL